MGCGSSKVSAVPDGCAMGTEPKYRGIKQTQGREVTILWDTDTTGCPPDNYTSLLFLNALHKVRRADGTVFRLHAPCHDAHSNYLMFYRCLCKIWAGKNPGSCLSTTMTDLSIRLQRLLR